jgi:regulator of sigma E protease
VDSLILFSALADSGWLDSAKNIAMVAIGLGFVIFVHELGHFLVAKACGVKCDKFYIGFDVPIPLGFFTIPGKLVHFQWGETEYGIGAIPLGGYVKMLGQDDNPNNAETEAERTRIRDEQGNVKLDPRSYQAKSVPQRMAIISAGVIMNIIFGFFFAAIAYRTGVKIEPAQIGATTAGDPAWRENLQPGDRIVQIGKSGTPNEHMRFRQDMMVNLMLYTGYNKDIDLLVRDRDGQEEWVTLRPSDRLKNDKMARPTIGITSSPVPEFGKVSKVDESLFGGRFAQVAAGDRIVAIDDEPVKDYADVQRLLAVRPKQTVKVTVERAASPESATSKTERYTLELPPIPMRDYGIVMQASPVTAIREGSPAEKAGLQVGDRLISFNGEPIGDPLSFPQRTLSHIGETVSLEVERGTGDKQQRITCEVTLQSPRQMFWSGVAGPTVAVDTLGVAYNVTAKIAEVREEGPAKDQLRPGDQIVKFQFQPANDEQEAIERNALGKDAFKAMELKEGIVGWPLVVLASSSHLPDTQLVVTVLRDGEEVTATLSPQDSQELFLGSRHLPLQALQELHQVDSWGEAFSLGAREMKERMLEVVTVVGKLLTGQISLGQLGGPVAIMRVATNEADRGITDLLMFFAFLSANLAVMNFLPIPALDGGHMLFLMYEAIFRKPVNENLQMKLSLAGILCLLSLMVFATVMDVSKLF